MVEYFAVDAPVVIVDPNKIGVSQLGFISIAVGICQLSVEPINVGDCQLLENVVAAEVPILIAVIIEVSYVGDITSVVARQGSGRVGHQTVGTRRMY